jgi:hypothetical protein
VYHMTVVETIPVVEIVERISLDDGFQVHTVVPREEGVVAVLLVRDGKRRLLIIEEHEGDWVYPTLVPEAVWDATASRRESTVEPMGIGQLWSVQSAYPSADERPESGWVAMTGVCSYDAEAVSIRSDIDSYVAAVTISGLFVGVLRSSWKRRLEVEVHTTSGEIVAIGPGPDDRH